MTKYLIYIGIIFIASRATGQPILSSMIEIDGSLVYSDFKDSKRYYYSPGNIYLAKKEDGSPDFKLIEMRYTGTLVTGNQGEARYMNIVQFKVKMKQYAKDELTKIKRQLPRGSGLVPLPLRNVEAFLVAPFEGTYKRIGRNGSFQSEGKLGDNTKTSYWTERIFTVRLENHEAQLLWDMVEEGRIGISVSYAYYADIIDDDIADIKASGSEKLEEEMEEVSNAISEWDSIPKLTLIHADAFNLEIDVEKYPNTLVKKDLNEGIPPSYPALQVMCFDFVNDLRPSLAMKTIEFEATGVSNRPVKLRPEKFLNASADLHTRQIKFPFAVDMRKPLRYRIKEYQMTGDLIDKGWKTADSWIGIMDITSQGQDIKYEKREVDVEIDLAAMTEIGINQVNVFIEYALDNKPKVERIKFTSDDNIPLKQLSVLCDLESYFNYRIEKLSDEGKSGSLPKQVPLDNFVYVSI